FAAELFTVTPRVPPESRRPSHHTARARKMFRHPSLHLVFGSFFESEIHRIDMPGPPDITNAGRQRSKSYRDRKHAPRQPSQSLRRQQDQKQIQFRHKSYRTTHQLKSEIVVPNHIDSETDRGARQKNQIRQISPAPELRIGHQQEYNPHGHGDPQGPSS